MTKTSMYLNRTGITAINQLKTQWGPDRFSQTNSRRNACYLEHVRLYPDAAAKKARKNFVTLYTLADIMEYIITPD